MDRFGNIRVAADTPFTPGPAIPGFLIGNTAESVIQAADQPVLTVKRRAFRSPVAA